MFVSFRTAVPLYLNAGNVMYRERFLTAMQSLPLYSAVSEYTALLGKTSLT